MTPTVLSDRRTRVAELNQLIERYLASSDDVSAAFSGLSREQLLAHPVPGKWSAMEVLCHLVDSDLALAMRIRAALSPAFRRIPAAMPGELTVMLAVDGRDASEELECFKVIRASATISRATMKAGTYFKSPSSSV